MMNDMLKRIDEVLDESEEQRPAEYIVALKRKKFETALQHHALHVQQERWLLRGVELGAVEPAWDEGNTWLYSPSPDCPLWLDYRVVWGATAWFLGVCA